MGAENRGDVFASFIVKQFPKISSVLDVAGGRGMVARSLANKGVKSIIIDPCPRFEGRLHSKIQYDPNYFTDLYPLPKQINAVIGMHPDEATAEIVLFSIKHKIPFALVPCCLKGRLSNQVHGYQNWVKYLHRMLEQSGADVRIGQLKMTGCNMVIYGKWNKQRQPVA